MPWYQLDDANDPRLDELAKQYNLHPLHIEDARSATRASRSTPLRTTPSPSSNRSVSTLTPTIPPNPDPSSPPSTSSPAKTS